MQPGRSHVTRTKRALRPPITGAHGAAASKWPRATKRFTRHPTTPARPAVTQHTVQRSHGTALTLRRHSRQGTSQTHKLPKHAATPAPAAAHVLCCAWRSAECVLVQPLTHRCAGSRVRASHVNGQVSRQPRKKKPDASDPAGATSMCWRTTAQQPASLVRVTAPKRRRSAGVKPATPASTGDLPAHAMVSPGH